MLHGAADAHGDIQRGPHRGAGLADLMLLADHAAVEDGADVVGQGLHTSLEGIDEDIGRGKDGDHDDADEQHVLDGDVVTYLKGGGLPDITKEESISDDNVNFFGGAGVIVGIRKQLDGYVTADYHDANNNVDDKDFDSDDLIVMTGLRFGF